MIKVPLKLNLKGQLPHIQIISLLRVLVWSNNGNFHL